MVSRGLIFIGVGEATIVRRRRSFGLCFKHMNTSCLKVRLTIVFFALIDMV
jgi:hypothetical protein